jgi:hypothetical protein
MGVMFLKDISTPRLANATKMFASVERMESLMRISK